MGIKFSFLWSYPERFFTWVAWGHVFLRWGFHLVSQPPIHGVEDLDIARHLVAGEGFSIYDRGPTTAKGPLYPFFLALFLELGFSPENLWPVVFIQHFLLSWMPLLMYRLAERMGYPMMGKGAGLFFALHPSFFYYPTVLENTSLFIFLTALWGILLYDWRRKGGIGEMLFLGVWLGLSWIEKPVAVLPMGVAIIFVAGWRPLMRLAVVAVLPILGWAWRGYWTFGYFTWTKTYAGQHTFAMSWHPRFATSREYSVSDTLAAKMDSLFLLPEKVGGPAFVQIGRDIVRQQGLMKVLKRTIWQAGIFWWIPPRYWKDRSFRFWIVRKLPVIVINAFFLLGLYHGIKKPAYRSLTLYIFFTSILFTFFYAINHTLNIRYRLDVEWLQLYVCAIGVIGTYQGMFRSQSREKD